MKIVGTQKAKKFSLEFSGKVSIKRYNLFCNTTTTLFILSVRTKKNHLYTFLHVMQFK